MKEKQTKENTKHANIKMPLDLYKRIEELAAESQRTVSGQIRFMLQHFIDIRDGK